MGSSPLLAGVYLTSLALSLVSEGRGEPSGGRQPTRPARQHSGLVPLERREVLFVISECLDLVRDVGAWMFTYWCVIFVMSPKWFDGVVANGDSSSIWGFTGHVF